jgi:uncharacterized protein DUF3168
MLGAALRAYLLDDVQIAALVGNRVYPLRLPQKVTLPAIVLTRISGLRFAHLRGADALARPRYQVDCWAATHDAASRLGALCRQRLNGYTGTWSDADSPATTIPVTILLDADGDRDLFDEDISGGSCRHSADYFVWHGTADGAV